jgi:A/G-specific adenine glycosylase
MKNSAFVKTIWDFYDVAGRNLPWRHAITPYKIAVSEIMLQQTQASRVVRKFDSFIKKFPSFAALAKAPTLAVLKEWQGLGYNRRALNLHQLAKTVVEKYAGKLPQNYEDLLELPGIGPNTAGSILAFAFNIPRPFIETNIRSVYIHFFFSEAEKLHGRRACKKIHDDQLLPIIEKSLLEKKNTANPREWYYALMDYGSNLKRTLPNPSRRSAHHVKQSKFQGSNRQLRSRILRFIITGQKTLAQIETECVDRTHDTSAVARNLLALQKEGFIEKKSGIFLVK